MVFKTKLAMLNLFLMSACITWKWSGKVGWNEYGEIAEDRLFETYQPTIWATISFLCLYQNCMYYKRDNVLYMSSYDSQCHVGKWSYFH